MVGWVAVLGASFGEDSPRRHEGHEGVAIEVHRHLGPGLLESIYEVARYREPWLRGGAGRAAGAVPVWYKGWSSNMGFGSIPSSSLPSSWNSDRSTTWPHSPRPIAAPRYEEWVA